jgi:hypothetical protein
MTLQGDPDAVIKTEREPIDLQWEPKVDGELMQLFYLDGCWDLATVDKTSEFEVLTKLQSLEACIPAFENRISHSDEGFNAWRHLHQYEMDAGRAQYMMMFRGLSKGSGRNGTTKVGWSNQKWQLRYAWIVRQREELAKIRYKHLEQQGALLNKEAFFGRQVDRPSRITVLKANGTVPRGVTQRINEKWHLTLDQRLRDAAGEPDKFEQLREAFWGRVFGRQPRLPESRLVNPEQMVKVKLESD